MTDQTQQPIEEQLLIRYCAGQATEEECALVEAWVAQSDDHERLLKRLLNLSWETDLLRIMPQVNTEKAWQRVDRILRGQSRRRIHRLWIAFQRVAAILLLPLLLAAGLFYYLYQSQGEVDERLRMVEVRTNPGMTTVVDLPDGTKVHLNTETTLSYPSRFANAERRVSLRGEAFFEVEKDSERPFIIEAPHQTQVEVLGTTFNLEAFESESLVTTTLLTGQVRFSYPQEGAIHSVKLSPAHKLVFDVNSSDVRLLKTDGKSEVAWKDGEIAFHATPLPVALHMLEKRFHVHFKLRNKRLEREAFTGTFTTERLEHILQNFKLSTHIRWRYVDTPNQANERTIIEIY